MTDRIVAGHPWIYQAAIQSVSHTPKDGEVVQVRDSRRRFLGIGFYNAKSKINVRIISRQKEEIDTDFFTRKLSAAQAFRSKLIPDATSYRLVNAEGDELSGLIIDRYNDVFSVQISSLGMEQRKQSIFDALKNLYPDSIILERTDIASRKSEGLPTNPPTTLTLGSDKRPAQTQIDLNGLKFDVDFTTGHKTGFYLDQQTNYQAAATLLKQWNAKKILDCFTYQGGFALHAARATEGKILGIDQSEDAIKRARANASTNGLNSLCEFASANVFDWLKEAQKHTRADSPEHKYDAIILDPPSFTRSRASVGDALRGYKEIHLRAIRLLKERGLLFSYCCSHHVDSNTFEDVIVTAAFDSRRRLRRIASFTQSPDHPIIPTIPETQYLKGFAFELLPR